MYLQNLEWGKHIGKFKFLFVLVVVLLPIFFFFFLLHFSEHSLTLNALTLSSDRGEDIQLRIALMHVKYYNLINCQIIPLSFFISFEKFWSCSLLFLVKLLNLKKICNNILNISVANTLVLQHTDIYWYISPEWNVVFLICNLWCARPHLEV